MASVSYFVDARVEMGRGGGCNAGKNAADLRGRARSGLLIIDGAVTSDTETVLFSSCEPDKPTHSLVQMGVFNVPTWVLTKSEAADLFQRQKSIQEWCKCCMDALNPLWVTSSWNNNLNNKSKVILGVCWEQEELSYGEPWRTQVDLLEEHQDHP